MIINWNGKPYALDFIDLTLKQAEAIEKESGLSLEAWLNELGAGTTKLQFVKLAYWLMLAQNGEEIPVGAVDFPLLKFGRAFAEAMAAEPEPAQETPGPTQTAPPGPTSPSPPDPPTPGTSPSEEAPLPATVS